MIHITPAAGETMKRLYLILLLTATVVASITVWRLVATSLKQENEKLGTDQANTSHLVELPASIGELFRDFQFLDENHGWGATDRSIWKTGDGGLTWIEIKTTPTVKLLKNYESQETIEKIQFLSINEGWVIEGKYLIHTTDGGASWQKHEFENVIVRSFHFLDSNNGWFAGQLLHPPATKRDVEAWYPVIYSTKDGGKNWHRSFAGPESRYPLWDVWSISLEEVWAVGAFILHSNDGGKTWERVQIKDRFEVSGIPIEIQFLNSDMGWITTSEGVGYLFTNDGGKTWEPHKISGKLSHIRQVVHITSTEAWAVDGNLYQSKDGGESWTEVAKGDYSRIQYLEKENILFVAGKSITKYKLP
jgi:photosystem II stability/assembly factor-like uncharacterized protein